MNLLYAQLVGAAAMLTISFSVQCRKKKNIMLVQAIANTLYAVQYTLLNAYAASSMNIITALRSLIYYFFSKKNKKIPVYIPVLVTIIIIYIGYLNYSGLLSLVPPIITIAYTISATYKNPKIFKTTFMICSFVWIYYNFTVEAYICIVGNVLEIISSITSIKRKNIRP